MKNVQKMIFAQKLIKLLACQTCQNKKKHPVHVSFACIKY
jgi:hypothetical protein